MASAAEDRGLLDDAVGLLQEQKSGGKGKRQFWVAVELVGSTRAGATVSMRLFSVALAGALVASCATRLPSTSFAEPAALERAMEGYYGAHAREEYYCQLPYIDGLSQVTVVDSQPDRLVVDVRYLYRDRFKNGGGDTGSNGCIGYAGRRFTLGKGLTGGVEVLEMTGPQH
jgi:hypothetical protein